MEARGAPLLRMVRLVDAESAGVQSTAPSEVRRDVVVVGASAGGVEALVSLVRSVPADSRLAFLVVLHMPTGGRSHLPEILSRAGPLPARAARDGAAPQPGWIHVAPPDHHLTLPGGVMMLAGGPRENGFRPAVDPLFRSAARSFGRRAIGVLLSGTMDDGVAGLLAIQAVGGTTIVQDPDDAMVPALPRAAIEAGSADHVVPASAIGPLLAELARQPLASIAAVASTAARALLADPAELPARGVDLSCPDCGGAVRQLEVASLDRYRCRVGHVLSPLSLLAGKGEQLEAALWAAVRILEETASISRSLAERSRKNGALAAARRFDEREVDAVRRAELVRSAITTLDEPINATTEEALAGRETEPSGSESSNESQRPVEVRRSA
jgi:two-component system chemotaxis response regulator CheB